ncbi:hypothetical protein MCOR27_004997 [Pyricularia oryzae]|uniref:Uncharacterized protein n=2 Tax=Pyricularia TaxID=48558 RepID=A0ABQ8NTY0_PYRGI|nr:hypothetical protein MCOR01_009457 [Pyricularia oryzae]KAI6301567.1 hypothetical protein MCOR33_002961 [Pyricularia grisea]KAH9437282.1 hypothetical protein MCOR02_000936 [Pyricularia oryzae]KAI6261235.1 hypothetical protein MCOR19_002534 [Pyricularia oryzae]KAI6279278.1 hypothetical protein MCOR26_004234 [Pyricularia oryzae]
MFAKLAFVLLPLSALTTAVPVTSTGQLAARSDPDADRAYWSGKSLHSPYANRMPSVPEHYVPLEGGPLQRWRVTREGGGQGRDNRGVYDTYYSNRYGVSNGGRSSDSDSD